MQLDHVAVLHRMLTPHLLSVESGCTPYARVPERAREIFVHEPRDVLHGLAPVEYERPSPVWRAARRHAQSIRCFEMPLRLLHGDLTLSRSYIYCTRSAPGDVFRQFAERAQREGWGYCEIDASHSPHAPIPA